MGRTAGRSAEATRRAVITAAARLIVARGRVVSLDAIAEAAGVSKGGLIYHFPSKDDLFAAIVRSYADAFRDRVMARAAAGTTKRGRLTRAYVEVALDPRELTGEQRDRLVVIGQLMSIPSVAEIAAEDVRRWERDLAADGVSPDIQQVVVAASDGAEGALLWGAEADEASLDRLRATLIGLLDRDLTSGSGG